MRLFPPNKNLNHSTTALTQYYSIHLCVWEYCMCLYVSLLSMCQGVYKWYKLKNRFWLFNNRCLCPSLTRQPSVSSWVSKTQTKATSEDEKIIVGYWALEDDLEILLISCACVQSLHTCSDCPSVFALVPLPPVGLPLTQLAPQQQIWPFLCFLHCNVDVGR